MNARSRVIERAFGSAHDYAEHAHVQRTVAERLARRIAALDLPRAPRILEIGCGTGFLTAAMAAQGIAGDWLVTDIAPPMVERCRLVVGEGDGRRFAVLDGENGALGGPYDLVCSSLAMQWFSDPDAALGRMIAALAPGGHCLFTTLSAGTFAEWRAAHDRLCLDAGTPRFVSAGALARMQIDTHEKTIVEQFIEHHRDALDFLRALKAIGARTPAESHRPLSAANLRKVMVAFEKSGAAVTYEVVTSHHRKPA